MLFKIYVDDLSTALNKCNVGCCFNTIILNHLYYADDLYLSSSVHGLNELLSISAKYATDHDIVFNERKSVCLYFEHCILRLSLLIQSTFRGLCH